MRVSVVLCTHTLDRYADCLEAAESVLEQTYEDVELVLVSDGSEVVCEKFRSDFGVRDDVVVHCKPENSGLLDSRNEGARAATGDVVAFIDDDAIADKDWVERLVVAYEKHDVRAVGGRMTPAWIAGEPAFLPEEFYWLVGVTHRGFGPGGDRERSGEVRNTNGSNISFERNAFLDLGGFDPAIGGRQGDANLQGGETELCERLRAEYGQGVYYEPEAKVAHKVFEYRTDLPWLLDRAFWQGYSKRAMETLVPDSGGEERDFLNRLATTFVPSRMKNLLTSPHPQKFAQLIMLFVFTVLVGAGYLFGAIRYRGRGMSSESENDSTGYKILWLRPTQGKNISVRRQRIAEKLENRGVATDIHNVSGTDIFPALYRAVSGDYDAVFGNVRLGLYVGYPVARVLGKPFVGTVSDPLSDFAHFPRPLFAALTKLEWYILSRADACSFTYQETADEANRRGIEGRKLPNAVDFESFADPDPDAVEQARRVLDSSGVDQSKPLAIYIGGLIEDTYYISEIIAAAEQLQDWEFLFIGEGEEEKRVAQAARTNSNVYFPGSFDYDLVPGFLAHATAGFCFKDAEQPLKVMEYGAAGVVTVGQPGELQNRLSEDEAVFIPPTAESIVDTLVHLNANPEERRRLASNLQNHASTVSWDEVADEFHEILLDVLD